MNNDHEQRDHEWRILKLFDRLKRKSGAFRGSKTKCISRRWIIQLYRITIEKSTFTPSKSKCRMLLYAIWTVLSYTLILLLQTTLSLYKYPFCHIILRLLFLLLWWWEGADDILGKHNDIFLGEMKNSFIYAIYLNKNKNNSRFIK